MNGGKKLRSLWNRKVVLGSRVLELASRVYSNSTLNKVIRTLHCSSSSSIRWTGTVPCDWTRTNIQGNMKESKSSSSFGRIRQMLGCMKNNNHCAVACDIIQKKGTDLRIHLESSNRRW